MEMQAARVQSHHSLARHQSQEREKDDSDGEADDEVEHEEVIHPRRAGHGGDRETLLALLLPVEAAEALLEDLALLMCGVDSVRDAEPGEKREDDADDDHEAVNVVTVGGVLVLEVEGVRDAALGSAGPAFTVLGVFDERSRHARVRAGMFVSHGEGGSVEVVCSRVGIECELL
jgi:hypothetical protein